SPPIPCPHIPSGPTAPALHPTISLASAAPATASLPRSSSSAPAAIPHPAADTRLRPSALPALPPPSPPTAPLTLPPPSPLPLPVAADSALVGWLAGSVPHSSLPLPHSAPRPP